MVRKLSFIVIALACLNPFVPGWLALFLGVVFTLSLGNPFADATKSLSPKLLAISIVGLGAAINFYDLIAIGTKGFILTGLSIAFVMALGLFLGRLLKLESALSSLLSFGTAICGGSAIAAAAPVIKAKDHEISIALAVVFSLNAIALLIFPLIGEWLELTQKQFGIWAALAIHDTSSVVGAGMQYGDEALEVATTVKLARALWIIPVVFLWALYLSSRNQEAVEGKAKPKIKAPWFIGGFVLMALIVTFVPALQNAGIVVAEISKQLLVMMLFLIGAGLSKNALRELGVKPVICASVLWGLVTLISLIFAKAYI